MPPPPPLLTRHLSQRVSPQFQLTLKLLPHQSVNQPTNLQLLTPTRSTRKLPLLHSRKRPSLPLHQSRNLVRAHFLKLVNRFRAFFTLNSKEIYPLLFYFSSLPSIGWWRCGSTYQKTSRNCPLPPFFFLLFPPSTVYDSLSRFLSITLFTPSSSRFLSPDDVLNKFSFEVPSKFWKFK